MYRSNQSGKEHPCYQTIVHGKTPSKTKNASLGRGVFWRLKPTSDQRAGYKIKPASTKVGNPEMFILDSGESQAEWFSKATSTAISNGAAMVFSGGVITPASAASTVIAGVSLRKVTLIDYDYALAGAPMPVWLTMTESVFIADVGAGSASAANVGLRYDLFNSVSVDLTASVHGVVTVVGVVSATKVKVKFNAAYENKDAA